MNRERSYVQVTTGLHYPIGDLYGYPDSFIRGRTGAAYFYGLGLIDRGAETILDFGSGRGHGIKMIQERLLPKIIVSGDKHFPYLEAQRLGLTNNNQEIAYNFVNLSTKLPFPDDSFDLITIMHVIEHVLEPEILMGELSRVLKDGGTLLLATPDIYHIAGKSPYDEHVFSGDEITTLLTKNGFDNNVYYISADNIAFKVHNRKKWLATHIPLTAKIRNHVNPNIWEPLILRSGISKYPLSMENFNLSKNDSQNAIDLLIVATKR